MKAFILFFVALAVPAGAIHLLLAFCDLDWHWYVNAEERGVALVMWVFSLFVAIPAWSAIVDD
jgi:hypothetical protein